MFDALDEAYAENKPGKKPIIRRNRYSEFKNLSDKRPTCYQRELFVETMRQLQNEIEKEEGRQ